MNDARIDPRPLLDPRPQLDPRHHLEHCVALAEEALLDGNDPFGSVLVDPQGQLLFADRNHTRDGDQTRHPEFEIARWAVERLSPSARGEAVVMTSGEHCPMCSAAHAWVGLGTIHYATSSAQFVGWLAEWGLSPGPVAPLAINVVAPQLDAVGPYPEYADRIRQLHARRHGITDT